MKHYTLKELEDMPTLHSGQYDNLKIDAENTRVWLSRLGVADGMPYDNAVTVETLLNGSWVEREVYRAL
jgi:hypothetical protein